MTTITNFIEGNFVANGGRERERPVWVVDSAGVRVREVVEAMVGRCGKDRKYGYAYVGL